MNSDGPTFYKNNEVGGLGTSG